jgi:Cu2+-containing amine oxidase
MSTHIADASSARLRALDPLSPDEIARAAEVTRAWRTFGEAVHFISITTGEPARDGSEDDQRYADVVLHDTAGRVTTELRIDLSWTASSRR